IAAMLEMEEAACRKPFSRARQNIDHGLPATTRARSVDFSFRPSVVPAKPPILIGYRGRSDSCLLNPDSCLLPRSFDNTSSPSYDENSQTKPTAPPFQRASLRSQ